MKLLAPLRSWSQGAFLRSRVERLPHLASLQQNLLAPKELADAMMSALADDGTLLDDASPADRIRAETEEETGYRIEDVRLVFEAYMSPGSVTEKLHYFAAEYDSSSKRAEGGGDANHGEEIEVVELQLDDALKMIETGEIQDGKTIMLLQHAKLKAFID